jgi:hypothetical protein
MGYVDGMSLYRGYFAPNGLDPSGLVVVKKSKRLFDDGNRSVWDLIFDDEKCTILVNAIITMYFQNGSGEQGFEWGNLQKRMFIEKFKRQINETWGNSGKGIKLEPSEYCEVKCKNGIAVNFSVDVKESNVVSDNGRGEVRVQGYWKDPTPADPEAHRANFGNLQYFNSIVKGTDQKTLAHEFGHMLGLPHPSGRWSGAPGDYSADGHGLMGGGNSVRGYDLRDIVADVLPKEPSGIDPKWDIPLANGVVVYKERPTGR